MHLYAQFYLFRIWRLRELLLSQSLNRASRSVRKLLMSNLLQVAGFGASTSLFVHPEKILEIEMVRRKMPKLMHYKSFQMGSGSFSDSLVLSIYQTGIRSFVYHLCFTSRCSRSMERGFSCWTNSNDGSCGSINTHPKRVGINERELSVANTLIELEYVR